MINRQSIFFTILISFLISILLVIISFIIILANSYKAQEEQIYDRYIPISKMINRIEFDFSEEIIKNFEEMNYKLYIEKKEINKITNDKNMKIFSERIHPKHGDIFRILKNNTDYYLYMKVRDNEVLVKDQNGFSNSRQIYIILVFSILLITITILYFMSLKKLMPLKVLKDKVKSLGDENFDFEYEILLCIKILLSSFNSLIESISISSIFV